MFFEYDDFIYGRTLTKMTLLKGIIVFLFFQNNPKYGNIKYVPKKNIIID